MHQSHGNTTQLLGMNDFENLVCRLFYAAFVQLELWHCNCCIINTLSLTIISPSLQVLLTPRRGISPPRHETKKRLQAPRSMHAVGKSPIARRLHYRCPHSRRKEQRDRREHIYNRRWQYWRAVRCTVERQHVTLGQVRARLHRLVPLFAAAAAGRYLASCTPQR